MAAHTKSAPSALRAGLTHQELRAALAAMRTCHARYTVEARCVGCKRAPKPTKRGAEDQCPEGGPNDLAHDKHAALAVGTTAVGPPQPPVRPPRALCLS
eukprot:5246922-Prymnesium_polylepis.1